MRFLRGEQHILRFAAATAAIAGVKSPICGTNVVFRREAEGSGCAVDRGGGAFEFEEDAYGGFVQVEVEGLVAEAGTIFFVVEARAET